MNLVEGCHILTKNKLLGEILEVKQHTVEILTHDKRVVEVDKSDILSTLPNYDAFLSGAIDSYA
jgi:preprotein translocase subunit YajC